MDRAHKLLLLLSELGLDAILVTDRKNVLYFSGFSGSNGYLVVTKTQKILVTDSRYTTQSKIQAPEFQIEDMRDFKIENFLGDKEKVGFENKTILYCEYCSFGSKIKQLVPLDFALTQIRSIKDDEEIKNISYAAQIADKAFLHMTDFIRKGMTELEAAFELEMYMRSLGASSVSFESIIASGKNGAMPHAQPSHKKMQNGDLVVMDFGCVYNGYCSDMTRTIAIGDVSQQQLDVYNTVLKVQKECINMAKPGAKCSDIHNHSFKSLDSVYKNCYGHGLGHGVGLEIHELPNLNPKSDYVLQKGNVITIEPGVYIEDLCGVRIEDLVVITDDGCKILSNSTKELIKIK